MNLTVLTPGIQTTVQAAPRVRLRHMGVPYSGPADPLSFALANHLVGNPHSAAGLEITQGAFAIQAEQDLTIALTGAQAPASIDDMPATYHTTLKLRAGQRLHLTPPVKGVRTYLSIAGGLEAEEILGSASTYLPASLGGYDGRVLRKDDALHVKSCERPFEPLSTPHTLRPHIGHAWALRACTGAEFEWLISDAQERLFNETYTVSRRADRMGLMLEGQSLSIQSTGRMDSAAVFPGTVQCPEDGAPFILSCDAQTTGGYPRILEVARCDRHMLGQLRPGDNLQFLRRTPEQARADLQRKTELFQDWLPGFAF